MPFQAGENVGPYRVVEKLGQGGMATVFKAYHPALDRFVALKVLHPAFKEDPSFQARFQREARVVAKLDHPNIVPIYDFAEHSGHPYLVMKFVEGRTLKATLSQGRLPQPQGLRIIEAVGEGLAYAHRRGVLHRDIKPSNILLDEEGGIYLADFGLARIAQAGESTLSSDMLLGTPQYISPEQARGESELDAGTDIYSFGVVIYELVVGRVPFNADTPFSVIHDHIYTPLPMPRSVNTNVPVAVERVLLKALAKERKDRFASVDEMVDAFQSAVVQGQTSESIEQRPVSAASPSQAEASAIQAGMEPAPDPHDSRTRSRRWLWVAGGVMLSCLCLGFLFLANRAENRGNASATPSAGQQEADLGSTTAGPDRTETSDEGLAVVSARQTVEANPSSPEAYYGLAQALYEAGFPARAAQPLIEGARLSMQRGDYDQAANALLTGMELGGGLPRIDDRITALAVEALFLAAGDGQSAQPVIQRANVGFPDWEVLPPINARLTLYSEHPDAARLKPGLLEELRGRGADPLAQAVLAEDALLRGENQLALERAREVFRNPESPDWLVRHVDTMMGEIVAD